jgi:transposase
MTNHTTMPKVSTLEVIQTGSRRRWTVEEKLRIVGESFGAPRAVSATARRYGLSSAQLFNWRRLAHEGKLAVEDGTAGFVPAFVVADETASEAPKPALDTRAPYKGAEGPIRGRMIIALADGQRVIVDSDVDAAALRRVLEVLERR